MSVFAPGQPVPVVKRPGGKPVILTFIANYLPGFKSGGIMRTVVNTVNHLGDEFEFLIVTRDRDLKENAPYPGVIVEEWQPVGGAKVYYLPPGSCTARGLSRLVKATPHDILYLNSFFDPVFTIRLLLARRLGWLPDTPVILAPRGEFVEGPLRLKYPKKLAYIRLTRLFGFYRDILWQASSEYETEDIVRVMDVPTDSIHVALDLPSRAAPGQGSEVSGRPESDGEALRLVFLSRLTREKNLDYALRVLGRVKADVVFDIVGPAEDGTYWKECNDLIGRLPANVKVNYLGSVSPDRVLELLSRYDLFFFPTTGENYGHVIAEALTAGTPVLISNETPWRDLETDGLGWIRELRDMGSFAAVIEELASMAADERTQRRPQIKEKVMERLLDPAVLEANRRLFLRPLDRRELVP
jgi:glycosyltransferase involved in cell wall biosynthesis